MHDRRRGRARDGGSALARATTQCETSERRFAWEGGRSDRDGAWRGARARISGPAGRRARARGRRAQNAPAQLMFTLVPAPSPRATHDQAATSQSPESVVRTASINNMRVYTSCGEFGQPS
eukprot:3596727-Pyramimonas_sp.AAC.1